MRRQLKDLSQWHRWFAWHPIVTDCGRLIWLETVERKITDLLFVDKTDYRLPEER